MARQNVVEVCAGLRKFRRDDYTVFTIEGENSLPFQQMIRDAVQAETGAVAIHVRSLKMISSGFVGLLMYLYKEMVRRNRRYLLLNPNLRLRDLVLVMGLNQELAVITSVVDLPPDVLGLDLTEEGEIAPGLWSYRVPKSRILSIEGRPASQAVDRLREILQTCVERVAVHVGTLESGVAPELHAVVLEMMEKGRRPGMDPSLLNPSIEFHERLRKGGLEQRFPIVTALDQL